MQIRVDLVCEDDHVAYDQILESGKDKPIEYPPCALCGKPTEQSYSEREEYEGYWVMNGRNW